MAKITLTNLENTNNQQTVATRVNANNDAIEAAFENTLSRDGTTPNQMLSALDMNSNRILNVPAPASATDVVRLQDIADITGGDIILVDTDYTTRSAAAAEDIDDAITIIRTNGFYAIGDGGGATYKVATVQATGPGKFEDAGGRWWELLEAEPNPKMFGAKGDGTTNDQTFLQDWLDFGGNLSGSEGVFILGLSGASSDGEYTLTIDNANTRIRAYGMAIDQPTSNRESPVLVVSEGSTDCSIEGLEIDGRSADKTAASGVHEGGISVQASGFTAKDCFIHDCLEDGIYVRVLEATDETTFERTRIIDCIFERIGTPPTSVVPGSSVKRGFPIWVFGDHRDVLLRGNIIRNIGYGGGGIGTDTYSGDGTEGNLVEQVIIANNVIEAQGLGIHYESSLGGVISGNDVTVTYHTDATQAAISVRTIEQSDHEQPGGKVTVANNRMVGTCVGLHMQDAEEVIITGNIIEITADSGETLTGKEKCGITYIGTQQDPIAFCRNLTITGNIIRTNCSGILVGFEEGAGVSVNGFPSGEYPIKNLHVSDNTVEFTGASAAVSGNYGIYVKQHDLCILSDNIVRLYYVNLFQSNTDAESDAPALVLDNLLADAVTYNIQLTAQGGGRLVTGNKTFGAGTAGIRFEASSIHSSTVLSSNVFSDSTVSSWSGSDSVAGPKAITQLAPSHGMRYGTQTLVVPASAMTPRITNGAAPGTYETSSNRVMFQTLDYDTTTQEFAQFSVPMPKGWDEGTVTFQPVWSHPATVTNFGVVWALQAVAISDDDTLEVAFGTEQTSTDTGGTTDDLYVGPESADITISGTPAEGDVVVFQVKRVPADGGDTLAVDARLHSIKLYFNVYTIRDN